MVNNPERIIRLNRRKKMRKNRLNVFFDYSLDLLKNIFKIIFHILKRIGYDGIIILIIIYIFVYLLNSVKKIPNLELPNNESQKKLLLGVFFFVVFTNLDKVYKKSKEKSKKKSKEDDDSDL